MDKDLQSFLEELAESIDIEARELKLNTKLKDLDWDSLAVISSIALADMYFNKTITADDISQCSTIEDLINICK
tara:strand:- start:188 stop:409 length:222 start_codon:yes stop_codon:yes gene_type:complete